MKEKNITKISVNSIEEIPRGRTNLDEIRSMSDEEVHRRALSDPDCQPSKAEQLRRFKLVKTHGGARKGAGRKPKAPVKHIKLDLAMLNWLKEKGNPRNLIEQAIIEKYGNWEK